MGKAISIDEAINKIIENYSVNIKGAVEYASDKAVEDIYQYAFNCLDQYYANYDPNVYNRTDHLGDAILPYAAKIKQTKKQISSTVGIQYDSTPLEGVYYSYSTKYGATYKDGKLVEPGHPDGWWVLENYLKGVHPATDGGTTYYEIQDPRSPYDLMDEYLQTTAMTNFQTRIIEYLIR